MRKNESPCAQGRRGPCQRPRGQRVLLALVFWNRTFRNMNMQIIIFKKIRIDV